ncbi:MAG: beta-lactamase family protein [Prevotellaceae bacterium]|jgi:CubicO group peptidase (beta-lactamase class C family)|nr:beta-lactamase family protein [Prevotellaceae bacterium]
MKTTLLLSLAVLLGCSAPAGRTLQKATPHEAGLDAKKLTYIDSCALHAIRQGSIPGAVVAVVRHNKLAFLEAYGNRQVYPDTLPMTVHTVFDLASVSKSVSTAVSVMILLERGQLRLRDNVSLYIPGFQPWTDSASGRRRNIRIIELLTHTSGLPPYAPVDELKALYAVPNPAGLLTHISNVKRNNEPGTVFDYSCLNFITLQHIVQNITGMSLQRFAQQNIFQPLGMRHTDYNPAGETLEWVAPTEKQDDGTVLRGKVHDPLANVLNGGVSGNAGLFSNAEDLSLLAAMLLNNGEINGTRILSPLTVRAMRSVPAGYEPFGRALGWDVSSGYANDGDLFALSAFGHTGYTGTSITIDPDSGTAVIILTNRVHPEDKGSVTRLRETIANVVAGSVKN